MYTKCVYFFPGNKNDFELCAQMRWWLHKIVHDQQKTPLTCAMVTHKQHEKQKPTTEKIQFFFSFSFTIWDTLEFRISTCQHRTKSVRCVPDNKKEMKNTNAVQLHDAIEKMVCIFRVPHCIPTTSARAHFITVCPMQSLSCSASAVCTLCVSVCLLLSLAVRSLRQSRPN